MTDWASRVTSYEYHADGALEQQTNVNGTVALYAYDNARRLLDVWNQKPGTTPETITRHQFTMDAVGNRTQVGETLAPLAPAGPSTPPTGLPSDHGGTASTAPTGLPATHLDPGSASTPPTALPNRAGSSSPISQTLSYGYDKLYRLTTASGGPAGATSYTYDPVGNRLTRTRAATTTTYAYDRADRITSATTPSSGTSYTVNAIGNMTARGSDTLAAACPEERGDQVNRLTQTTVGSTTATYAYDGDGKRASKTCQLHHHSLPVRRQPWVAGAPGGRDPALRLGSGAGLRGRGHRRAGVPCRWARLGPRPDRRHQSRRPNVRVR